MHLNEIYKLAVQMLQGLANIVFFILSYACWGNIQWWFWDDPYDTKNFLAETVGIVLGCIQYYWLFLMGCVFVIAAIFICMAVFSGGGIMNAFRNPHNVQNSEEQRL